MRRSAADDETLRRFGSFASSTEVPLVTWRGAVLKEALSLWVLFARTGAPRAVTPGVIHVDLACLACASLAHARTKGVCGGVYVSVCGGVVHLAAGLRINPAPHLAEKGSRELSFNAK